MHWDMFCRVIDNYGDIGVCWRLAADLARAARACGCGSTMRRALAWMAPDGATGVQVVPWPTTPPASSPAMW